MHVLVGTYAQVYTQSKSIIIRRLCYGLINVNVSGGRN